MKVGYRRATEHVIERSPKATRQLDQLSREDRENQIALRTKGTRFFMYYLLPVFILVMNLLGMIPFLGSPTASIWVTGALALCSFAMMHGAAILAKHGNVFAYLQSLWPRIEIGTGPVAWLIGQFFSLMIFTIEIFGTVIKSFVLAVRLFANMFAGHVVLATILIFIYVAGNMNLGLWGTITVLSVLGQIALSLLELFVAFLQAYIFTFLTSLFLGMALHPEH